MGMPKTTGSLMLNTAIGADILHTARESARFEKTSTAMTSAREAKAWQRACWHW